VGDDGDNGNDSGGDGDDDDDVDDGHDDDSDVRQKQETEKYCFFSDQMFLFQHFHGEDSPCLSPPHLQPHKTQISTQTQTP
jgi:hypothetical protein